MSSLIVQVCKIDAVEPHPNADRMEIVTIKGWRSCISKGAFAVGDLCVYIPPDSVLPVALSDRIGVTKYLSPLPKNQDGNRPEGGRIRVARLRGEKSYGLVIKPDDPTWSVGFDVAQILGVTKYDPPQPCTDGDAERPNHAFLKYTDVENYRNFPTILKEGEEVVFTEKLHGKNARVAFIREADEAGAEAFVYMVGSHEVRRKEYMTITKVVNGEVQSKKRRSQFWDCLTDEVKELLVAVSGHKHNVIVYGEMIGQGVQDMAYGVQLAFRAFDISVDGKYLDYDEKKSLFDKYGVQMVPILYRGPFSKAKIEEFTDGPTTMCDSKVAGTFKGREGIVITPVKERFSSDMSGSGRVILKSVSFAYLERSNGTEFH